MPAAAAAGAAAPAPPTGIWWFCGRIGACFTACCVLFGSCVKKMPPNVVEGLLRVINIVNAVLLCAASYFAFTTGLSDYSFDTTLQKCVSSTTLNVTRIFLATYIGLFGVMLFLFETRVKYTAPAIRRNFGFLFTYTGRTSFLIFLGAVCFGMLSDGSAGACPTQSYTWCLVIGIATLLNAFFNCFIICNHPGYQAGGQLDAKHAAEAAGNDPSKMTEAQVKSYLAAHPEIAAAALGGSKQAPTDAVAVAVGEPAWASGGGQAAEAKSAGKSGGWGFGGFGGKGKAAKPAPAPIAGSAASDAYVPPVVPAYSPPAATAAVPAAAPAYAPPAPAMSTGATRTAAATAAATPLPGAAFVIDDNPFAS